MTLPEEPTVPILEFLRTLSPSETKVSFKWEYVEIMPLPWSIIIRLPL